MCYRIKQDDEQLLSRCSQESKNQRAQAIAVMETFPLFSTPLCCVSYGYMLASTVIPVTHLYFPLETLKSFFHLLHLGLVVPALCAC